LRSSNGTARTSLVHWHSDFLSAKSTGNRRPATDAAVDLLDKGWIDLRHIGGHAGQRLAEPFEGLEHGLHREGDRQAPRVRLLHHVVWWNALHSDAE
jgi:hypothetical protein